MSADKFLIRPQWLEWPKVVQILALTFLLFLGYLICERIAHNRRLHSIPLRIAVTGTRGKSSVVRLLASILREDGRRVMAKTTGSEARSIFPDGEEHTVPRRGITSIIEQKKIIKKASELAVDCIVVETMSIQPECHRVESQQLIQPHVVAVTNVRRDHIDAMGETEEEIASVLCLDFVSKATVFLPEAERHSCFDEAIKDQDIRCIRVAAGAYLDAAAGTARGEFADNLDLAYAVAKHLGIGQDAIQRGILNARRDLGQFRVWRYIPEDPQRNYFLANAFAANDPQSTMLVLSEVRKQLPQCGDRIVGLLSLRSDRPDRTRQWIAALRERNCNPFRRLFLIGDNTHAARRRLPFAHVINEKAPEDITAAVINSAPDRSVIFGFGNVGGLGKKMIQHWNRIGDIPGR
jgi:poly-gamma-glutamate synthase PgsB/CapB